MMTLNIYLILLIVVLLFNLVFWVLVIWFRILFDCEVVKCCSRSTDDTESILGHRNLGFVDTEDLYNNRPPTIAELMESPPSYEEALKFEQFGFPVLHTSSQSSSASLSPPLRPDILNRITPMASTERLTQVSQSPPRVPSDLVRSRSSTSASNSALTPIREEDIDETPVTVVIDCIGVQASRLMENCDTKLDISGGENLKDDSKC